VSTTAKKEYLHIVPVGTSILINFGWKPGQKLPAHKALAAWVAEKPSARSAELNAMLPSVRKGECTHAHLVATGTPAGRLCRDALADCLAGLGVELTGRGGEAGGLLPESFDEMKRPEEFYAGVCRFREMVFRVVATARKRGNVEVMVNATGGLKSMTAMAALVAAELGVSAYYIHQSMEQPVYLPTVALDDGVLGAVHKLAARGGRARASSLRGVDLVRLEREGLVTISRKPDGEMSAVRLTAYGKHLAKRRG
jgi:putative CRISPR-associated protein (TIGR02619 family)